MSSSAACAETALRGDLRSAAPSPTERRPADLLTRVVAVDTLPEAMTMTTTPLTLTAAVSPRGGAQQLFNGQIELHGLKLEHISVEPQIAAYRRMVRTLEFDICELAPTTYLCARALGRRFTAIPVSLSRGFHH